MKYGIIVGSHRPVSNSGKVGRYVQRLVESSGKGDSVYVMSLAANPLPLWDESMWETTSKLKDLWKPYSDELKSCDALIVISPEWSGMVPAGLKNFFLYCGNPELAHKPGLIIAVSAGSGGAYPVTELRASSYKNTHLCYIPDHVIVRTADAVLNDPDSPASEYDTMVRKRLAYSVRVLGEYAKALKHVRESGVIDHKEFANGM